MNGLGASGSSFGGSWDLVSKVISTFIGVISRVTLIITLVTKSHDPLSSFGGFRGSGFRALGYSKGI